MNMAWKERGFAGGFGVAPGLWLVVAIVRSLTVLLLAVGSCCGVARRGCGWAAAVVRSPGAYVGEGAAGSAFCLDWLTSRAASRAFDVASTGVGCLCACAFVESLSL